MAEDLPITHARLDLMVERLDAIQRKMGEFEMAITDFETTLVVLVERFNQFAALYRTDHHGVGRGGVQGEGA